MTDELERGQAFGPYVLEARLGGGGFGTVWRARETATGRLVALKVLAGKFSAGETGKLRADVEVLAAAASAGSEHVVRVLGGGPDPVPHVVMEFIEGPNLEDELERLGRMSQQETLRVVRGVSEALAVLQNAGIIHRDIKPANVMLARDGTVKLTDFGIAKIAGYESVTATGQLPLTGAYAAPEVWAGEATAQSDHYALGAMAFQLLTGERPFNGNFVQLYEMHRNRDPEYALLPGETPPALRQLIVRCLAKDAADRPVTTEDLLVLVAEAERQLAPGAVLAQPASHEPRALGPWLIEKPHETQPWAFRCLHETSGERATVEVHFSDSLELGESLKRAVAANPSLVPLGAERLLGTNRLILRPGEAWRDPPPGQFMFWVARQELPAPAAPALIDDDIAFAYAAGALALVGAAHAAGLAFHLHAGNGVLARGGAVYATRVGLPDAAPAQDVTAWLRAATGSGLFDTAQDDIALTALVSRPREDEAPAQGVARAAVTTGLTASPVESQVLARDTTAEPALLGLEETAEPEPAVTSKFAQPVPPRQPPKRDEPVRLMWLGGAAGVAVVAAVALWFIFGGGEAGQAQCGEEPGRCATMTMEPSPTSAAIATATRTPTIPPSNSPTAATEPGFTKTPESGEYGGSATPTSKAGPAVLETATGTPSPTPGSSVTMVPATPTTAPTPTPVPLNDRTSIDVLGISATGHNAFAASVRYQLRPDYALPSEATMRVFSLDNCRDATGNVSSIWVTSVKASLNGSSSGSTVLGFSVEPSRVQHPPVRCSHFSIFLYGEFGRSESAQKFSLGEVKLTN